MARKSRTTPMREEVAVYLESISKAALLDCLVDMIGLAEGCDPEEVTLAYVKTVVEPRLKVRGDRAPASVRGSEEKAS